MLIALRSGDILPAEDYFITHKESGLDELELTLSSRLAAARELEEEDAILECSENLRYLIKAVSVADDEMTVRCQLDLNEWKRSLLGGTDGWAPGEVTAAELLNAVLPEGWSLTGSLSHTETCEISLTAPTPLEAAQEGEERFGFALRFDNLKRTVRLAYPSEAPLSEGYLIRGVNLKEQTYSGKSADFVTRLYARGAEGVTLESVCGGKEYIEDHSWSEETLCGFFEDSRCTTPEQLLTAAKAELASRCVPARSWVCSAADLYRMDPERWQELKLSLLTVVNVTDERRGLSFRGRIAEETVYPHHPGRNRFTISAPARTAQESLIRLKRTVEDRNSALRQQSALSLPSEIPSSRVRALWEESAE